MYVNLKDEKFRAPWNKTIIICIIMKTKCKLGYVACGSIAFKVEKDWL